MTFPHGPVRVLDTDRLRLEPVEAAHAPLLFDLWQDPAIYTYVPEQPPATVVELERRYAALESRQSPEGDEAWLQWLVRLRDHPRYLGRLEASVFPDARAVMAWMFASSVWGHGYASESSAAVLSHLRLDWGVVRVRVEIDARNESSLRLAERLGFERVAYVRDADAFKGEISHEVHWEGRLDAAAAIEEPTCPG